MQFSTPPRCHEQRRNLMRNASFDVGRVDSFTYMLSRQAFRVAAFACAVALLSAACGGGSQTTDPAEQSAPAVSETPESVVDGSDGADPTPAPAGDVPSILQFTSTLVGGGEINAAELADKPTAFWFWAPT
ncbi:MAG: hypothetical protein ACI8V4_003232 [Ilumatobacter sp.]|jgi:hypothetical protein